jgi:hypothetical protein
MANRKQRNIKYNIPIRSNSSKIDLLSGGHTTSIIVAVLFILVYIGLIFYSCLVYNPENIIINGLFSLLFLLGGFFVGSQIKNREN